MVDLRGMMSLNDLHENSSILKKPYILVHDIQTQIIPISRVP
jgi:hypothetical protein